MKSVGRLFVGIALLALFVGAGLLLPGVAVAGGKPVVVVPVNAKYAGKSYPEWSDAWWKWALGVPADVNPLFDETGDNALQGQSGDVYFLAGAFNVSGQAERAITVPPGKALFFPILNVEWDNLCPPLDPPPPPGELVNVLKANVTGFLDAVDRLEGDLDGVEIPDLARYRVGPGEAFSVTIPAGNVYETFGCSWATAGTYTPFVSGGYYLLLTPLSVGEHTLHFTGHTTFMGSDFTLDITYHITVGDPPAMGGGGLLARVAPNPLNPLAKLTFTTREAGPVSVQLFDLNGRLVRTLLESRLLESGDHSVVIDGRDQRGGKLPSGVLFYRIRAGDESATGQFVVMK